MVISYMDDFLKHKTHYCYNFFARWEHFLALDMIHYCGSGRNISISFKIGYTTQNVKANNKF